MLLAAGAAQAHDFWMERDGGGFVLRYGHRGGEARPIDVTKLRSIRCVRPAGASQELLPGARPSPKEVRFTANCLVASAYHHGGFWSLTPDGEKNLPRRECPDAVKSWESRQWTKWIDIRSPAAGKPIGDELEIVPVTDLSRTRSGDKASFRVLLQGKPLDGATVSMAHKVLGETDSAGEVRVRIRATDVESVSVSYRRPISSTDADVQVLEAALTFEVAR